MRARAARISYVVLRLRYTKCVLSMRCWGLFILAEGMYAQHAAVTTNDRHNAVNLRDKCPGSSLHEDKKNRSDEFHLKLLI